MTIDAATIQLAAITVTVVGSGVFLTDTFLRRPSASGRWWALMFVSATLASLAYAVWFSDSGIAWLGLAIGNGSVVAAPVCFWCGARAYNGRPSWRWIALAPVVWVLAALAVVLDESADDSAASIVLFVGVAVFAGLGAVETLRGALRADLTARALTVAVGAVSVYFVLRTVVFAVRGSTDPLFREFFGAAITALLYLVVMVVVVVTLVVLQGQRVERWIGTGGEGQLLAVDLLSSASFESLARDQLERGEVHRMQLVLSKVVIDDREPLRAAFGRGSVEVFDAEVAAALVHDAPPGAIVGLGADGAYRVLQTTPNVSTALECGRVLQAGLRLLESAEAFGVTITASIGVAGTERHGYDLEGLDAAAGDAAAAVVLGGGDDVVAG